MFNGSPSQRCREGAKAKVNKRCGHVHVFFLADYADFRRSIGFSTAATATVLCLMSQYSYLSTLYSYYLIIKQPRI